MSNELVIYVIIFALIGVVLASLISKLSPLGVSPAVFVLAAVCVWIAYDYIMLRHKHQTDKTNQELPAYESVESMQMRKAAESLNIDLEEDDKLDIYIDSLEKLGYKNDVIHIDENDDRPQIRHKNEFDINMYDRDVSIKDLYADLGCEGDTIMSNRMKYMSMQAKMSKDNRARHNAEKLKPMYHEELTENEKAEWWNQENAHLDLMM